MTESLITTPEGGFGPRNKAFIVTPKVTGGLSMMCSLWLAYSILSDREKRATTKNRLLVVLCLCDCVPSFGYFLSSWPLPEGNNYLAAMDSGDNALCKAQGFFIHWGVATAACNVVLAMHYLLVVRFNYSETQLKKFEPYYLGAIFVMGWAMTIPAFALELYSYNPHSRNKWCFIFTECEDPSDQSECIRSSMNFRWILYFGPLWLFILTSIWLTFLLYRTVRGMELASRKWTANAQADPARQGRLKQTRRVAIQAGLYVVVFIVVWAPQLILDLITTVRQEWLIPEKKKDFVLLFAVTVFQPLQGFLNLFVYRRLSIVEAVSNIFGKLSKVIARLPCLKKRGGKAQEELGRPQTDPTTVRCMSSVVDDVPATRPQEEEPGLPPQTEPTIDNGMSSMAGDVPTKPQEEEPGLSQTEPTTVSGMSSMAEDVPTRPQEEPGLPPQTEPTSVRSMSSTAQDVPTTRSDDRHPAGYFL